MTYRPIVLKTTVTNLSQFCCPSHDTRPLLYFNQKHNVLICVNVLRFILMYVLYDMICVIVLQRKCQLAILKWRSVKIRIMLCTFLRFLPRDAL